MNAIRYKFLFLSGVIFILTCTTLVLGMDKIIGDAESNVESLYDLESSTNYKCSSNAFTSNSAIATKDLCTSSSKKACLLKYYPQSGNLDYEPFDYDRFTVCLLNKDYVNIKNERISDGMMNELWIRSNMVIHAPSPPSRSPNQGAPNIMSGGIIKSKDYILVDSVYIPKLGEYAEFDVNSAVLESTMFMDRNYLIQTFFINEPQCVSKNGLLSPMPGDIFDADTDLSLMNKYVNNADAFVLNPVHTITERNSVATILAAQSSVFNRHINCLHENTPKREKLVRTLPSKLYFYMIASGYLSIGTAEYKNRPLSYDYSDYRVFVSQSYPSTQKLILNAYQSKGDVLRDAYKYKDLPIFQDFVYSLASKGELSNLILKTDSTTREFYLSVLLDGIMTYHSNPVIMTDMGKMRNTDMQNRVALWELNKLIKDGNTRALTKKVILKKVSNKTAAELGPYMQFFLLENRKYFDKTELETLKNFYDPKKFRSDSLIEVGDFYGFYADVLKVYTESKYIPIDMMIEENHGKYYLKGSMFFGSIDQMSDFDMFVNYAVANRFTKQKILDPYYDSIRSADSEFNLHDKYAMKLTRIQDITFKDRKGVTRTYKDVNVELTLYKRRASEFDPLTPFVFTRGHIGDSSDSLDDLLKYNSKKLNVKDMPLIAHLSGCSENGAAQDLVEMYKDRQIIISATSGVGTRSVNDPWIMALVDSISVKGITNVDEQTAYIHDTLKTKGVTSNPNYQYYMTGSEFSLSKLRMQAPADNVFSPWSKVMTRARTVRLTN